MRTLATRGSKLGAPRRQAWGKGVDVHGRSQAVLSCGPWPPAAVRLVAVAPGFELRHTTSTVSSGTLLGLIVPPVRRSGHRTGYFTNTWPPAASRVLAAAPRGDRLLAFLWAAPACPSHPRRRPVSVDGLFNSGIFLSFYFHAFRSHP